LVFGNALYGLMITMMLKKMLDVLVCPIPDCRKPLTLAADEKSLQCTGCQRAYPITDGIPILLAEKAITK
jgi:uncharacterized protein YbaR (Trm112 family)